MSGLQWIRRRQQTLARAVLPLVALAWVQVAAIPCVAAHQSAGLVAATVQESSDPRVEHELAAENHGDHQVAHETVGTSSHGPCPYCPPEHAGCGDAGAEAGRCAFPHDPQVDARVAGLAIAPPVARISFALQPEPARAGARLPADRPGPVPRSPFTVSYCRFIE